MSETTGTDIQEYNYMVSKAEQNDIKVKTTGKGFVLTRNSDGGMLGKMWTVRECFNYLCGYEVGLDKGLVDSIVFDGYEGEYPVDDQEW